MSADSAITVRADTLHSVLNQLALIVSYADLMMRDLPDRDERRRDLVEMRRCASDAARLLGRPFDAP